MSRAHDLPGFAKATDLGPGDISWLREITSLPVVIKGVLRADDAVRCVRAGASAVWVSNHGGRQLDQSLATADVMPGVVAAVGGHAPVLRMHQQLVSELTESMQLAGITRPGDAASVLASSRREK